MNNIKALNELRRWTYLLETKGKDMDVNVLAYQHGIDLNKVNKGKKLVSKLVEDLESDKREFTIKQVSY